ncbi:hypothetical protein B0G73_101117 [Paraburkholderia sp. BL25I1N1]|nr:hypothetical protein [Paraburkholderia sp. BL25I1N1]PRY09211.1 hypothetical protein B0G73_101117 [Paraburkholderia sp. BL25I1N1]
MFVRAYRNQCHAWRDSKVMVPPDAPVTQTGADVWETYRRRFATCRSRQAFRSLSSGLSYRHEAAIRGHVVRLMCLVLTVLAALAPGACTFVHIRGNSDHIEGTGGTAGRYRPHAASNSGPLQRFFQRPNPR